MVCRTTTHPATQHTLFPPLFLPKATKLLFNFHDTPLIQTPPRLLLRVTLNV